MRRYEEVVTDVQARLASGGLEYPEYKDYDYVGVGFGYNLQHSFPKNVDEAMRDTYTPLFDEILRESRDEL